MRHLLMFLVRCYQQTLSRVLPPCCIYRPSCSEYMIDALRLHGIVKGLALGTWRILRCHPFAKGGWDPVPGATMETDNDGTA